MPGRSDRAGAAAAGGGAPGADATVVRERSIRAEELARVGALHQRFASGRLEIYSKQLRGYDFPELAAHGVQM